MLARPERRTGADFDPPPLLPFLKKGERRLDSPERKHLLDLELKERPVDEKGEKHKRQTFLGIDSETCGSMGNGPGNLGETVANLGREVASAAGKAYEAAKKKGTDWLEAERDWKDLWRSAKSELKKKLNTLDDYATPIYKEAGKAARGIYAALQEKLAKKK